MRVEWHPEVITAAVEKKAMDRLAVAGEAVANRARAFFPLKAPPGRESKEPWKSMSTGLLLSTIRVTRLKGDPKQNIRVYAGTRVKGGGKMKGAARGAFYSHMIEYGTMKMAARPFLRPAINGSGAVVMMIMNGYENQTPVMSGGWGDVLNFKPDPGRQAELDIFEQGLR